MSKTPTLLTVIYCISTKQLYDGCKFKYIISELTAHTLKAT